MRILLAIGILCFATFAHGAGIKFATVPADSAGPRLKVAIWTPCARPPEEIQVGPYRLRGSRDCPTVRKNLPLVVISHGHGGSYLGHHDLAEVLADAGFIVAAINHPGDTFADMSRAAELSEFVERPVDITRLIDFMLSGAPDAAQTDANRIGFFGFSRGGYTGLVLAGGSPDFNHAKVPCDDSTLPLCQEIKQQSVPSIAPTHDPRIKSYVLADPLNVFPQRHDLENVEAPIAVWASQYGGDGVLPDTVRALVEALPRRPAFHVVPHAGHFAFLAPCPDLLKENSSTLCVDAPDFDRIAFHTRFNATTLGFFNATLRRTQ